MRKKSEEKRQQILEAALALFKEVGFEAASMNELSNRVGGSKATLYGYFASKEEIFSSVMLVAAEDDLSAMQQALETPDQSLEAALLEFGLHYLTFNYGASVIAARRLAIAEANRGSIGQVMFERGVLRLRAKLADFLKTKQASGEFRAPNMQLAAMQFLGLLRAEFDVEALLGIQENFSKSQIKTAAKNAVTLFVNGYRS